MSHELKKIMISAVLAAGALGVTGTASAVPIIYSDTQIIGSTLANGSTYSNTFDLSSVIRAGYDYTGLSGIISFVFADDGDVITTGTTIGSYGYAGSQNTYTGGNFSNWYSYQYYYDQKYFYDRTITTNSADAAESAAVNAEGATGTASSAYYSNGSWTSVDQTTSSTYTGTSSSSWWWGSGYDYAYTNNYNVYRNDNYSSTAGYGGANIPFLLSLPVDQVALLDGTLDYSMQVSGDLILKSVSLSITGDETISVPEPVSLSLAAIGLLGLGVSRRRRST